MSAPSPLKEADRPERLQDVIRSRGVGRHVNKISVVAAMAVCVFLPAAASAHVERSAYWPDPAPDCSIKPCTGGAVPKERSLASALDTRAVGDTRVVCRPESLRLAKQSIERAWKQGYDNRPTDHRSLSRAQGKALL